VYRELREELSLGPEQLTDLRCCGLVEDHALRQPELIFMAATSLPRDGIEARLDGEEHHETWSVGVGEVEEALADASLTPVAVASLLLWRKMRQGVTWREL
jgi:hypothetical protein